MGHKIFAFDVDGTLLNSKHELTDKTKKALKMIEDNGDVSIIASGRHWFTIRDLSKLTGIKYAISNNGGAIYDFNVNKAFYPTYFKTPDVEKIIRTFDVGNNDFGFIIYTDDVYIFYDIRWYKVYDQIYLPALSEKEMVTVNSIDEMIAKAKDLNCLKIIPISKTPEAHARAIKAFEATIGKNYEWFSGNFSTFEVNPKGVNKWLGVKNFSKLQKIDLKDTITFGDGRNDIAMLEKAHIGVVMGQSPADVIKAGNYITKDNDSEGIYDFVEKFYKGQIKVNERR